MAIITNFNVSGALNMTRDGSGVAIDPAEVAGVQIFQGQSGGPYSKNHGVKPVVTADLPAFSIDLINVSTDDGEAVVAKAVLTDGLVSVFSNEVFLPMPPNPPILT